jgi:hypothetical protein
VADIDRRKHEVDVLERVLGSAGDAAAPDQPHTEVVDISVRPWLGGTTTSAVQVTVGGVAPDSEDRTSGQKD